MDDAKFVGAILMIIVLAGCFFGLSYSLGYESALEDECNKNNGVFVDMRCLDKKFLLSTKLKQLEDK
mgnify:CR=1 FL=1